MTTTKSVSSAKSTHDRERKKVTEEDEAGKKHNTTHSEVCFSGNVCADLEHGRQHTATEQQQKTN